MSRKNPQSYTPSRGIFARITFRSRYAYRQEHAARRARLAASQEPAPRIIPPSAHKYEVFTEARLQASYYRLSDLRQLSELIKVFAGRTSRAMYQPRIKVDGEWKSGYKMAYPEDITRSLQQVMGKYAPGGFQDLEELDIAEFEDLDSL